MQLRALRALRTSLLRPRKLLGFASSRGGGSVARSVFALPRARRLRRFISLGLLLRSSLRSSLRVVSSRLRSGFRVAARRRSAPALTRLRYAAYSPAYRPKRPNGRPAHHPTQAIFAPLTRRSSYARTSRAIRPAASLSMACGHDDCGLRPRLLWPAAILYVACGHVDDGACRRGGIHAPSRGPKTRRVLCRRSARPPHLLSSAACVLGRKHAASTRGTHSSPARNTSVSRRIACRAHCFVGYRTHPAGRPYT